MRRKRKPLTPKQARRAELLRLRAAIRKRHRRSVRTARRQERRKATRQAQGARRSLHRAEVKQRGKRRRELTKLRRKIRKRYAQAEQRARRKERKKATRARQRERRKAHRAEVRARARIRARETKQRQRAREKLHKAARKAAKKVRDAEQRGARKARNAQRRATSRADQAYHKASAKVVNEQIKQRSGVIAAAIARIGNLRGAVISAGFTGDPARATHGAAGETVASVAYANEYGVGVPERPFMRITNARDRRAWFKGAAQIVQGQARGAEKQERGIRRLGLMMISGFKRTIRDGVAPPNSPETIARKGSSKTLVDTGQMINSIRADIHLPDGTRELIA